MSAIRRTWLITGASQGFGRIMTQVALRNDENVVATCRKPADLEVLAVANPERLLVVKCDVTSQADVLTAFAGAVEKFGRVDVVFNNAGAAILAEVEATPEDAARALFDLNFWGALAVSKEAIRVFRDVNPTGTGGRLLNVSSVVGMVGQPVLGIYSASKHALEGMTESLRLELNPAWNIKVSIVAPGAFRTGAHTRRIIHFPRPAAYDGEGLASQLLRRWFEDESGVRGDPDLAAQAIFKFSRLDNPPVRWVVGKDAIAGTRAKIAQMTAEMDAFDSWSDNLELVD